MPGIDPMILAHVLDKYFTPDTGPSAVRTRQLEEFRRRFAEQRRLRTAGKGAGGDSRLAELEAEVAELELYMAAMVCIMVDRGLVDINSLALVVMAVDAEDGKIDGCRSGSLA